MTGVLLDTNVIAETTLSAPDPRVLAYLANEPDLWLSTVVIHELQLGIELRPAGRRRDQASDLIKALVATTRRIVPVGLAEAEHAAELRARARRGGRTLHLADALIAATAALRRLTLVTRNVRDFDGLGLHIANPWELPAG